MKLKLSFLSKTPCWLGVFFIALLGSTAWAQTTPVTKKVMAILVEIQDGSGKVYGVSSDCDGTKNRVADILFGSQNTFPYTTNRCFQEASYGNYRIGGATYPGTTADVVRVRIRDSATPLTSVNCMATRPEYGDRVTHQVWADEADKAARAQGKTITSDTTRVYVLPNETTCGLGISALCPTGENCRAWVKVGANGCLAQLESALLHELGHHLLYSNGDWIGHAATDYNNDGTAEDRYGDHSDFMGISGGWTPTLNAVNRVRLGWLNPANVTEGSAGGTFTLYTLDEKTSSNKQVVKIVPGTNIRPYYLSYRTRVGCMANNDTTFSPTTSSQIANQLQIHRESDPSKSQGESTLFIKSLSDGQSFTDNVTGYTFTQISHTDKTVTFSVIKAGGSTPPPSNTCTRAAPIASLSPTYIAVNSTPVSGSFQLKVTNKDSAGCPASTFKPNFYQKASGWTYSFSASSVTLNPGASQIITVNASTTSRMAEGAHYFRAGTLADELHKSTNLPGRFIVDYTKPLAPTNLQVMTSSSGATLTWPAAKEPTAANGIEVSGVQRYRIYRNGVLIAERSSTTYSDRDGRGSRSYAVKAVDRAGNVSDFSKSVTVSTP